MESNNKTMEESKSRKKWWLLLLLPLLLVGAWWFFPKQSAPKVAAQNADIKFCHLGLLAPSGHCCTGESQQISLYNDGSTFIVSATMPGKLTAPLKAVVRWATGEVFPTGDMYMIQDEADTNGCYYTLIKPLHGIKWKVNKYKVQVLLGDQVIGERDFEIVK